MRAKPFSSAQKKKQLQEKREQKRRNKDQEWDWNQSSSAARDEPAKAQQSRGGGRSLVSQFQRLTAEELEEKKREAQIPIATLSEVQY